MKEASGDVAREAWNRRCDDSRAGDFRLTGFCKIAPSNREKRDK